MNKLGRFAAACAAVLCAFGASAATTYTWTGGGDGTTWEQSENWGKTAAGAYPKSTADNATFSGMEVEVVLPEELEINQLDVKKGASVTIKSAGGKRSSLSLANKIAWSDTGSGLTLDGVTCRVVNNVQPASGGSLLLTNAASLYCALMELSNTSESYITLTERSYVETSGRVQVYKYGTLTIDDSTLVARDSCYLGNSSTGGGTIVFKGASPVLSCRNQFRASGDDAKCTADFNLNFEIPLGGFKDVPIQLPNAKAFDSMSKCPSKYVFNVLETSPALLAGTKLDVPVVIAKNGAVDARMAAGSGAALATTKYDGTAATADADRKVTHLVVNPSSEEVQTPVVVETTRINEWLQSSVTVSVDKNGRQIQPNLFVTMLANDGTTTRVTLEGGLVNDPSTFTDGPLAATISAVGQVNDLKLLYWEAPKGVFQECFVRCRVDQLDADGNVVATAYSDVFSNTTHDNATYTWQAVNGVWDGNVNDRAHWKSSAGEDDRNDYPSDINSRPVFPKNCTATVTIPETLPFGRLTFNTENADITFVSAGGDTNIVLQAYEFNMDSNAKSRFTLDHAGFSVASGTTSLGTRHEFRVLHSYFKCTPQMRINSQSSTTANQGTNVQVLMDDSECYFGSSITIGNRQTRAVIRNSRVSVDTVCFGYHLAGGTLRFEGDHPVLTVRSGGFRSDTDNTSPTLEFVVPEGGYQELPLQLTKNPSVCFLSNNSKKNYAATVRISPDSPILFTDFSGDIPLVDCWTKGIDLTCTTYDANTEGATFIFSDASEYAGGTFNWTEEKSGTPKAMGVRITGTPRTADSLLVTGRPNLNLTASPTPEYGLTTGHAVGESVSIKAPAQVNDDDAKISAVCTGYRVYAGETLVQEVVFDKDSSREAVLTFPDDPQGLKLVWTWDGVVYSLDNAVYFVSNSGTWRMKDESGAEMMGGTCTTTLNAAIDAAPEASVIYVKNDYDCSVDTPKVSDNKGGNCMYMPNKVNTIRSESGDWRTGPTLYGRKLSTTVTGAGTQAIRVFAAAVRVWRRRGRLSSDSRS